MAGNHLREWRVRHCGVVEVIDVADEVRECGCDRCECVVCNVARNSRVDNDDVAPVALENDFHGANKCIYTIS